MITFIRSVFEEGGNFIDQFFLDDALYEFQKYYGTKKFMFQKELTLIKQVHQGNVSFAIIATLKMLNLNLNRMFVINVTMY